MLALDLKKDASMLGAELRGEPIPTDAPEERSTGGAGNGEGEREPERATEEGAAAGAPEPEAEPQHVPNPAPMIRAALMRARSHKLAQKFLSARVLAVFDDATCDEVAEATGGIIQKHGAALAGWLDGADEWKEELRFGWCLLGLSMALSEALDNSTHENTPHAEPQKQGQDEPPPHVDGVINADGSVTR